MRADVMWKIETKSKPEYFALMREFNCEKYKQLREEIDFESEYFIKVEEASCKKYNLPSRARS